MGWNKTQNDLIKRRLHARYFVAKTSATELIRSMITLFPQSAMQARGINKDYTIWLGGVRPPPKYIFKNKLSLTNLKIWPKRKSDIWNNIYFQVLKFILCDIFNFQLPRILPFKYSKVYNHVKFLLIPTAFGVKMLLIAWNWEREREREGERDREWERGRERKSRICPELLFLFLKGMTGALAPFSYLVKNICELL